MKYEIKHCRTGKVIFFCETETMRQCVEQAVRDSVDLHYADLSYADLRGADLWNADLGYADLRYTNLRDANLDFSSGLPFRCSSFDIKADIRLAAQLAYHFCRIDFGKNADAKAAQVALKKLANQFHRVNECGEIK